MSNTDYCQIVKVLGLKINDMNQGLDPFVDAHELEKFFRKLPFHIVIEIAEAVASDKIQNLDLYGDDL